MVADAKLVPRNTTALTTRQAMSFIEAEYLATRPEQDPAGLAEAIAREQSLEILPELIPADIARDCLGQVRHVRQVGDHCWSLGIAYPAHLASDQVGQLLQLLYGNVSFYPRIRLDRISLPDSLLAHLPGPLGGIELVREHTGVSDRALLIGVLKPRGSSTEFLSDLAYRYALAGGDILKDDQNLVEKHPSVFRERIERCAQAVDQAAQETGKRCLYLPHVAGSGAHLQRQLEAVGEQGLAGVVFCPWVMGLEHAATAARDHGLMWLAHPAMAGACTQPMQTGIAAEIIFGQLPRLAGADMVIYPGSGGRISLGDPATEASIHQALLEKNDWHLRSLPCTGGGKTLNDLPDVTARHGKDCAIVVGGELLQHRQQLGTAVRDAVCRLQSS